MVWCTASCCSSFPYTWLTSNTRIKLDSMRQHSERSTAVRMTGWKNQWIKTVNWSFGEGQPTSASWCHWSSSVGGLAFASQSSSSMGWVCPWSYTSGACGSSLSSWSAQIHTSKGVTSTSTFSMKASWSYWCVYSLASRIGCLTKLTKTLSSSSF